MMGEPLAAPPREEDEMAEPEEEGGTAMSGTLNLSNTVFGGGIAFVALPLATKQVGVAGIVVLLLASCLANSFTCMLLVKSASLTGRKTYFGLASKLGIWKHGVTLFVFLNNLGVCVAFLDTFGDVFPQVMAKLSLVLDKTVCVLAVSAMLVLPMVGLKSLNALRYLSAFSIVLCLYFVGMVIGTFATRSGPLPSAQATTFLGVLNSLSTATLSYTCHYNVLPIWAGLKNKGEMRRVVHQSMVSGTVAFCICGPLAFYCHPGTIGDILSDFRSSSDGVSPAFLGQLAVALALFFTFPLIAFEGVHCAHSLVLALSPSAARQLDTSVGKKIQALVFIGLCAALALFVKETGKVIGFVGSFCGIPIMYLFPCAIYLKASESHGESMMFEVESETQTAARARDRRLARVGFVLGVVCFGLCNVSVVLAFGKG